MIGTNILIAIFFPIIFCPIFFLLERYTPKYLGFVSIIFPITSLVFTYKIGHEINWNDAQTVTYLWVPSLGVDLSFLVDGLSLFFSFLVTGMGVLVCFYSQFYMTHRKRHIGRFYCSLILFMGVMLGTVFSNNLILMFLFWELTGLASFILIGFSYQDSKACYGARMAFLVTSLTGLAFFVGIIMLGMVAETFNLHEIVTKIDLITNFPVWFSVILVLFLIGIFGKSAQFPFHFWLPNAMIAPTPVSAYLHAATMVQLGIFLTARIYPLFILDPLWFPIMSIFCYSTMLIGAYLSLISNELKAILAYATVSQLGFFIGFYGIGNVEGVQYDFVHILNHAFYKGSLFMLVGIVTLCTGIKDITKLGGLWRQMPITAMIFLFSCAAMAGIPGTTGFLSKEMFLADLVVLGKTFHSGWLILFVLFFASLFKVAFSIRLFYHIFLRKPEKNVHLQKKPSIFILTSPFILSIAALVFGIWPTGLERLTDTFYVSGLHTKALPDIGLWHGWRVELLISIGIFASGTGLFLLLERSGWKKSGIKTFLHFEFIYDFMMDFIQKSSIIITKLFHSPRPDTYAMILFSTFSVLIGGYLFFTLEHTWGYYLSTFSFKDINWIKGTIVLIITIGSAGVVFLARRISQLISFMGSSFVLTFYFVLYKAPDLAMTQILVDVVTLFLLLILFYFFGGLPIEKNNEPIRTFIKWMISFGMGLTASLIVLVYGPESLSEKVGGFFLENSLKLAKGANAVNTILVDFRGLDTIGEVSVLLIASLGVLGLLFTKTTKTHPEEKPGLTFPKKDLSLMSHLPSPILRIISRYIFFVVNLFAFHLLIRGHDLPGGGFIAGLCTAISILLLGISLPIEQTRDLMKIDPVRISVFGLLVIFISSIMPMFFGYQFLSHNVLSWDLGQLGNLNINTPLFFDVGVFLIVIGMAVKIVYSFRFSSQVLTPIVEILHGRYTKEGLWGAPEEMKLPLFRSKLYKEEGVKEND